MTENNQGAKAQRGENNMKGERVNREPCEIRENIEQSTPNIQLRTRALAGRGGDDQQKPRMAPEANVMRTEADRTDSIGRFVRLECAPGEAGKPFKTGYSRVFTHNYACGENFFLLRKPRMGWGIEM